MRSSMLSRTTYLRGASSTACHKCRASTVTFADTMHTHGLPGEDHEVEQGKLYLQLGDPTLVMPQHHKCFNWIM